jgi:hypothetical protein
LTAALTSARRSRQLNSCSACGSVEGVIRRHDLVVSSDSDDLQAIAAAADRRLEIDPL